MEQTLNELERMESTADERLAAEQIGVRWETSDTKFKKARPASPPALMGQYILGVRERPTRYIDLSVQERVQKFMDEMDELMAEYI
jgi:hypothetical protein